jgi:pimeloyl-ACP methyl ester carboxylesterase
MTFINSNGVRLYAESTGSGTPIVFIHPFNGDYRSWEGQVRHLARRYQCITFNARGYPPSDVPDDIEQYSQRLVVEDIANVMRQLEVDRAHVVGFSMGGYSALNFGMEHPEKVLSLVVVGAGHGSDPSTRKQFLEQGTALADNLVKLGLQQFSTLQAANQIGRRHKEKDPRGYEQVRQEFVKLSALGCSLTFRGCQLRRPTIYELEAGMKNLTLPTLIVTGDDDDMCLEPAFFMKKSIPDARLWIVPRTTHAVNLEESEQFNRVVSDFIAEIEHQRQNGIITES